MRNVTTAAVSGAASELSDILLVASITKTLSSSTTRHLPSPLPPLPDPLLLRILTSPSLPPSKTLDFFLHLSSSSRASLPSPRAFSSILSTAARASLLSHIPHLLRLANLHSIPIAPSAFKSLLDAAVAAGDFSLAVHVIDAMESLGAELKPEMYASVLAALVRKDQLSLASAITLRLLQQSDERGICQVACNELLVALRKREMKSEFKQVFDEMRFKAAMDTWSYNICIHAFGCWADLSTSLSLFKEMKELNSDNVGPDLATYNSLIQVLCVAGKVDDAISVWEDLKCSGHEPDAVTYRILVQGCCKCYRIDEATRIFSEMESNGYVADTVVYNTLIDGLFKARKVNEGCKMFERMVQYGVKASTWTYNILIDGLFKNARAEAAYTMFCDLKKKGRFVDGVTYSIVVLQLCREGMLEEALGLVEEMETRGFAVDLVTISTLMIGLYRHSQWDWAEKLMRRIREGTLLPSVVKWKLDLEATMKAPQKDKKEDRTPLFPSKGVDFSDVLNLISSAASTINGGLETDDAGVKDDKKPSTPIDQWSSSPHMDQLANKITSTDQSFRQFSLSRGIRVQAKGDDTFDIDMVNTFLSLFLAKGQLSIACKLFEIFSDVGAKPVSYTYNSILSSFVKKGYFNEALGVLSEMGERICPTDIATYNMIIQGLGKIGRADLASSVLDKLMKQGGYLDVVMYNTLINALGKANRIDEVNKLFKQMKGSGINPDVVTYNTLIEVHTKAGQLKAAYKFLKMMLDSGCTPNHVTDTILDFLGKEIEKSRYRKASFVRTKNDS